MDSRKIKLALTVDLINYDNQHNLLDQIKNVMSRFTEVGAFLGERITLKRKINEVHERQSYAIQYENCTVDIDLIEDERNAHKIVQGFKVR